MSDATADAAPAIDAAPTTDAASTDAATDAAPTDAVSAEVARCWVAAWTRRDLSAMFRLMAAGLEITSNLDPDGDFVEIACDLATAVDSVDVVSETLLPDGRVALVYACTAGPDTVRVDELLDIQAGLVTGIRRTYDVAAAQRVLRR